MSLSNLNKAVLSPLRIPSGFNQSIQNLDVVDLKRQSDLEKLRITYSYKGNTIDVYALEHKQYNFHYQAFLDVPFLLPENTDTEKTEQTTLESTPEGMKVFYRVAAGTNPAGTPLFIGRNVSVFETGSLIYIGSHNGTSVETFMDLEGNGIGTSVLTATRTAIANWADVGTAASFGFVTFFRTLLQAYAKGYQVNSPNALTLSSFQIFAQQVPALGLVAVATSLTGTSGTLQVNDGSYLGLGTGESSAFVDRAAIGANTVMGDNVFDDNLGSTWFRADKSLSITAFANVDKTITSFADSTLNTGVDTTCFQVDHRYWIGQIVLIADEAAYNGLREVVRTTTDSFDINVVFSTSGAGTSKETEATTSAAHGLLKNETQTISVTANYNGETQILNIVSTTKFTIPVAFVATETGTIVSTGLTEASIYVDAINNGDAKDSVSIGSLVVNDNAAATTISTINTYVDLNLNAIAVAGSNIEGWTLTNTTTGELRYDGISPFFGGAMYTISAQSSGAPQEFVFRIVKNGSILADDVELSMELKAETGALPYIAPITAVTGDLFRLQVQNIDGTSNVVIRFLAGGISE